MAAPPPALPTRDAGCLGVPAGALGPVGFGVALRPVEVVPVVVLTQKYLWPNSDPGNKLPHTVGREDPWKAILSELMAAAGGGAQIFMTDAGGSRRSPRISAHFKSLCCSRLQT